MNLAVPLFCDLRFLHLFILGFLCVFLLQTVLNLNPKLLFGYDFDADEQLWCEFTIKVSRLFRIFSVFESQPISFWLITHVS